MSLISPMFKWVFLRSYGFVCTNSFQTEWAVPRWICAHVAMELPSGINATVTCPCTRVVAEPVREARISKLGGAICRATHGNGARGQNTRLVAGFPGGHGGAVGIVTCYGECKGDEEQRK